MSRTSRLDIAFLFYLGASAALFVPRTMFPGSWLAGLLSDRTALAVAASSKLVFLLLAFVAAAWSSHRFEKDNPARGPWRLLALGLGLYLVGQSDLGYHQLVLGVAMPFPSLGDVFFVAAEVLLVAALASFVIAFRHAGYLPGSSGQLAFRAGMVAAVLAVAGVWILAPVASSPAPPLERFLNLAYPILDFLMLVPVVLLLLTARKMAGGRVAKLWITLLFGFVFLAGGDILFAYLTSVGTSEYDAAVDFLFLGSYLLIARGALYQGELLAA